MDLTEKGNFELYSSYYDLLYSDKDYAAESAYVSGILQEICPGAKSVLELGSGTGNYSSFLCRQGYGIMGLEASADMIDIAVQKQIPGFRTVAGDMTHFDLGEQYDAVLALFHVISYLNDNEAVLSCFRSVERHLKPGGCFVLDVWYTPAVYAQGPEERTKTLSNDVLEIVRHARPEVICERNVVQVHYEVAITGKKDNTVHRFEETHSMRHFGTPELTLLAQLAGLSLLRAEAFLTQKSPGTDTWGVCYILQKYD